MKMKSWNALVISCALMSGLVAKDSIGSQSRISIKHREHNGVGYGTGYTSATAFIAPNWQRQFLPFVDLRAHVFNDGEFAFNGGLGTRYAFSGNNIFGANLYYDFRSDEKFRSSSNWSRS